MRRSSRYPLLDLTPLVDILFLLILFFVLTTTFVRQGYSVVLPSGEGEVRDDASARLVLTSRGTVLWNGETVFLEGLEERIAREPITRLSLEADRQVPYGEVMALFSRLRAAGVAEVVLLVEEHR